MVKVLGLTKYYQDVMAIHNLNFEIEKDEIVGLLGPNGAGKSTTMNSITGYISPTKGTVEICGYDIAKKPMEVKKRIGYLPELPPLYPEMTVAEYLKFVSDLKGVPRSEADARLAKIVGTLDIGGVYGRLIKNLSKGYQQRVGLAQAIINHDVDGPEVLILDEPTIGLDPKQIIAMRELIRELGRGKAIMLSSHILPEVSAVCDRVIIINKGEIVGAGTSDELAKLLSSESKINVIVEGQEEKVFEKIRETAGVKSVCVLEKKNNDLNVYQVETDDIDEVKKALFFAMAEIKAPIVEFGSIKASLEDVFLQLVSSDDSEIEEDEICEEDEEKEEAE